MQKPSKVNADFSSAKDPFQDLLEGVADEWFQVAAAARRCLAGGTTCPVSVPTRCQQLDKLTSAENQFPPNPCFGETLCVVQRGGVRGDCDRCGL